MVQIAGQTVWGIGYGMMGLTWRASPPPKEQAFAAMRAAVAHGTVLFNGGEFYGPLERNSLVVLKEYLEKYPEDAKKIVLNIKGGLNEKLTPDGSAEVSRNCIERSLKQLGDAGKIDMWEPARRDPNYSVADIVNGVQALADEGKIGAVSLSEVNAATIREAAKVTKIASVEVELSLFSTDVLTNGVAQACAENDIPLLAYSPVSRGFLTGELKKFDDLPKDDMRRHYPRFQPENFDKNLELVDKIRGLANKKGCTVTQLAINWVRCLSKRPGMPVIIPIPGSTTPERVKENMEIIDLTDTEMNEIDELLKGFETAGGRYPESHSTLLEG